MFNHIYSTDYWLGFASGVVAILFVAFFSFIVGFVQELWRRWKNRNKPKGFDDPVGYITKVSEDFTGLKVEGILYPGTGVHEMLTEGAIKDLSMQMPGMPIMDRLDNPGVVIMGPDETLCRGNQGVHRAHPSCLLGPDVNHGPHAVGRIVEKAPDTSWVREENHG